MSIPSVMPDTSPPEFEVEIEHQVPVPMRDGTILRADVYRPAVSGRFPVVVERVAYELGARVGAGRARASDRLGSLPARRGARRNRARVARILCTMTCDRIWLAPGAA